MILVKIKRPDDEVYCSIMWNKGKGGYQFVNLSHNHVCKCTFKTVREAFDDLKRLKEEGSVINYTVLSSSFNLDVAIKQLFG